MFFISVLSLILSVPTFVCSEPTQEDNKNLKVRHDYKLTFKKPYYYNLTVPFFDTYGRKSFYGFFGKKLFSRIIRMIIELIDL
jgi:hypothetical protein